MVLHGYTAVHPDELNLKPGQVCAYVLEVPWNEGGKWECMVHIASYPAHQEPQYEGNVHGEAITHSVDCYM